MGKQIREQHSKIQKQKEKLLREIKMLETKLRTTKDELASATMTKEKLEMKVRISVSRKSTMVCFVLARHDADR